MDWMFQSFLSALILSLVQFARLIGADGMREINMQTRIGNFTGVTHTVLFDGELREATQFLGIPFAIPPVGDRRFTKPEPYRKIHSLYDATFHRPHCIQTRETYEYIKNFTQSEDCLYLNIYIPGNGSHGGKSYPVMIYIHGGSFVDGGADVYDGSILSAFYDVIIVTVNYRLNVFGFLSNGGDLKGNYGLWDMKLAIQWVHDNIVDFGGDVNKVTLFGNSAGGAAVLYQAIHPSNRGLFQRVISESGSCFAFWAIQKNPAHNFQWYLTQVGCDLDEYSEQIECLRALPPEQLQLDETEYTTQFVPTVDQDFLPESPEVLSRKLTTAGTAAMDFFTEVDLLNGVTSKDGAFALGYWSAGMLEVDAFANISDGVSDIYFKDKYIPEILSDMFVNTPEALIQSTIHQYTDWSKPRDPVSVRDKLMEFESDVTFFVPATFTSRLHDTAQEVNHQRNNYFYVFNHKPDFAPEPHWLRGATHVMELPFIFGFPEMLQWKLIYDYDATDPFIVTPQDLRFSKFMMTAWTNFAKSGNPNIPVKTNNRNIPEWPPFDSENRRYLELSARMTSQSVKHHLAASRIEFWDSLVPVLKDCNTNNGAVSNTVIPVVSLIADLVIIVCVSLLKLAN